MPDQGGDVAVAVRNLRRNYRMPDGGVREALADVSFSVGTGQIVGVLGPNGAGKTTTIKIISGLLTPTSGQVLVNDIDVASDPRAVQRLCGVALGGDSGFYPRLSALDNLRFFGTMYGLSGRRLRERAEQLLDLVALADRSSDRVESFSRGMRQRLHIARALLHDPPVVVLDEPSSGLDPQSAAAMRALVRRLVDEGRSVLLTTHDLREAEELCGRVLIFEKGRLLSEAAPVELRRAAAEVTGTRFFVVGAAAFASKLHAGDDSGVDKLEWNGDDLVLQSLEPAATMSMLTTAGVPLSAVSMTPPSLEQAYLRLLQVT